MPKMSKLEILSKIPIAFDLVLMAGNKLNGPVQSLTMLELSFTSGIDMFYKDYQVAHD